MPPHGLRASLGKYGPLVDRAIIETAKSDAIQRIWRRDASLWKKEEEHQKTIRNALGWLTVPEKMSTVGPELLSFAEDYRTDNGFRQVLLCGMGGSSLCPEVLTQTFGHLPAFPQLLVLDSTDPDVLAAFVNQIDLEHALFIIASKSGTTTEPLVFYKFWYGQVAQKKSDPGQSFIAITDPGSPMVESARDAGFRKIFLNQPDIGGRYSALSYFGIVPAALMGLDIGKLLSRAGEMAASCAADVPAPDNPGAFLGAVMGEAAKSGRDKLTIVTDKKISSLGLWVEQLIAESTGKEGKGILPVAGEQLGPPSVYSDDRLFVSIAVGALEPETQAKLKTLEAAGHPIVYRTLTDLYDIGAEFFLWEFATALAGWRLGINPFDQPNVQESKDATKELLTHYASRGKLEEQTVLASDGTLTVYADAQTGRALNATSVLDTLRAHLATVKENDYIALLDYIEETPAIEATLQAIAGHLRNATRSATTTGYGPRFLHSTGQFHKGGPDKGVFIQITAPDRVDLAIPGEPYTFGILKQAQALGDFHSLASRGRRAIRIDLGADALAGLVRLQELIVEALPLSLDSTAVS
jgi:transaldolase/glucose-6-phosphate isomerase